MAKKKLKVQTLEGTPVSVYWDSEWQEYLVKVKGQPDATYHTTERNDALATAQHMRNTIAYRI